MTNNGLFSKLFIDQVRGELSLGEQGEGRFATLTQLWQRRDAGSAEALWKTFVMKALSGLGFNPANKSEGPGFYPLCEQGTYDFQTGTVTMVYLVEPGSELDDTQAGRFWPVKLVKRLRERHLNWGILTDGSVWRLYSTKTAKPYEEYVELRLAEALAKGDHAEYALFERFFHAESFLVEDGDGGKPDGETDDEPSAGPAAKAAKCRLDRDAEASEEILAQKVKAPLLAQVDEALQYICNGFIQDTQKSGEAYTEEERQEIFQSAVKLLYRCMFLFYAESRKLLPSELDKQQAYDDRFSIRHLCGEARRIHWGERADTQGYDLWQRLKGLVLAVKEGEPEYGIMGYNGGLFNDEQEVFLGKHRLRNDFLARALYLTAYVRPPVGGSRETEYEIPFRDLEVRHLGELYENILEFNVQLADADRIRRQTSKGTKLLLASQNTYNPATDTRIEKGQVFFAQTALERKQTGSYYTPESMVGFLVNKTVVQPLRERFDTEWRPRLDEFLQLARTGVDESARRGAAREAEALVLRFIHEGVLRFRVCDPAMGSGHFLLSVANRMTDFILELLDGTPASGIGLSCDSLPNTWRRQVTRHCLYGVDLNPLAVNLAKLSLWLNSFARDHKLTFLDHRLKVGNSLIGLRSLDALKERPLRNNERKRKKQEAAGQLFNMGRFETEFRAAADRVTRIAEIDEDDTDRQKGEYDAACDAMRSVMGPLADLYTAYLMDETISPDTYRELFLACAKQGQAVLFMDDTRKQAQARVHELCRSHHFFHWPLEFPDVFAGADSAGFDATVGNPPWDVIQPSTQEFYSTYDPDFRKYSKREATVAIAELQSRHPEIAVKWATYADSMVESSVYFKELAVFECLQKGKVDLYKAFLERFFQLLSEDGGMGIVVPSGLYTDQGCLPLRKLFFERSRIDSLYCFENRWPVVFPAVHNSFKFVTFCTQKGGSTESFKCAFMEHDPERLAAIDGANVMMSVAQVRRFSPASLSILEIRDQASLAILERCYSASDILAHLPGLAMYQELNVTSHAELLNRDGRGFPLWEGKNIWLHDSYWEEPQFWVDSELAVAFFRRKYGVQVHPPSKDPRLCFRGVSSATNERTIAASFVPPRVVCEVKCTCFEFGPECPGDHVPFLLAGVLNSFVFDFCMRFRITCNVNMFHLEQAPFPRAASQPGICAAIAARVGRLACVVQVFSDLWPIIMRIPGAWESFGESYLRSVCGYGPRDEQEIRQRLADSARELTAEWGPHCGVHDRMPDRRDTGDRAQFRAEIDAYVAHLYGLSHDEFAYILDTFPVLKRKEEKAFGEFKSKRKCLEEYDRIAETI